MGESKSPETLNSIADMDEFANTASYSLLETLNVDPEATDSGEDYWPRQVFSGHYIPVKPTPIGHPIYVSHSAGLFAELGIDSALAQHKQFEAMFSGDLSGVPASIKPMAGQRVTHFPFTAPSITSSVRSKRVMAMAMVELYRYLKVYLMASDGKCNSKVAARPLTAGAQTVEQYYVPVCVSF